MKTFPRVFLYVLIPLLCIGFALGIFALKSFAKTFPSSAPTSDLYLGTLNGTTDYYLASGVSAKAGVVDGVIYLCPLDYNEGFNRGSIRVKYGPSYLNLDYSFDTGHPLIRDNFAHITFVASQFSFINPEIPVYSSFSEFLFSNNNVPVGDWGFSKWSYFGGYDKDISSEYLSRLAFLCDERPSDYSPTNIHLISQLDVEIDWGLGDKSIRRIDRNTPILLFDSTHPIGSTNFFMLTVYPVDNEGVRGNGIVITFDSKASEVIGQSGSDKYLTVPSNTPINVFGGTSTGTGTNNNGAVVAPEPNGYMLDIDFTGLSDEVIQAILSVLSGLELPKLPDLDSINSLLSNVPLPDIIDFGFSGIDFSYEKDETDFTDVLHSGSAFIGDVFDDDDSNLFKPFFTMFGIYSLWPVFVGLPFFVLLVVFFVFFRLR